MAEKLTPQQEMAVCNRGGKLLVSAAAGSGKTKVLVDRLMSYLLDANDPANLDDFLIITYTKAAASELRGKIAAKLSELIAANPTNRHLQQQMQRLYLAKISTVHGFCSDVLRQYAFRLDITSDFRVADESECLELQTKALEQTLDEAYETAKDNPDFLALVDTQGLGRDDRQIPEVILKVYSSAKCHLNPAKWLDWCVSGFQTEVSGVEETPWGAYLVNDLKEYSLYNLFHSFGSSYTSISDSIINFSIS
jgi:ATP-dependent helicase/nuclease subunit A